MKPHFSIIIPCKNEAEDIADTLEACLKIDYPHKDITVVDDSTDDITPGIISRYADRGVRLIHRERNSNGCCGARNLGMQEAKGDIVVLMNGDDRPSPDFLDHILVHYKNGADFVVVRSKVQNRENLWGQLIYTEGRARKANITNWEPNWSEGYSCRREAAEKSGYIPGDFPIPFCRDNLLSPALEKHGFKKVYDPTIIMEHVSPSTLSDFWRNQVWRGSIGPLFNFYINEMPLGSLVMREIIKLFKVLLLYFLIIPMTWRTIKRSRYTSNKWKSIPGLFYAGLVQDIALTTGYYKGLRLLFAEGK